MGHERVQRVGLLHYPQADTTWRGMLYPQKMASGRGTQHTDLKGSVPSALSPEPQTPDSSHVTLVHYALPQQEPRLSG